MSNSPCMKTRISTTANRRIGFHHGLVAALLGSLTVSAIACDISIDGPDDGVGGSDTDADDDEDDGGSRLGDTDHQAGSSGPVLPTAGDDGSASDSDPTAGDDGSSGGGAMSACGSYCVTELSCDSYFDSQAACLDSCEAERLESADCAPAHDEVNTCLAGLNCDDFMEFWFALNAIDMGEEPGDFPCVVEFFDYAACLAPDSDGSDGGDSSGGA